MNGIQHGKNRNLDKPFPGCLGRMVNLFDLSTAVAGNKLLTDKPHQSGSPISRSQSYVSAASPLRDLSEDEEIASELRRATSNTKTPIKMPIAEEMVKEVESNHSPSNLVAKLMGLEGLPPHQPDSISHKKHFSNGQSHEIHHFSERNEYKDVYEIWPQQPKTHNARGKSPLTANEKKMALVRQKFIEAKRLATDANLRQSKQFQEALEVLSSNKDMFLNFLQEPDSLFSQQLYNLQSNTQPSQTNRITVLRPSTMAHNSKFASSDKKTPNPRLPPEDNPAKPTRIVVLKPNVAKNVASQTTSPLNGRHRRDETLISSVFSNGYNGDESSFNKSEIEYAEGILSDSETTSPVSRHSWDFINSRRSPSFSSISKASFSADSSVCREAKKRLSERWALVASKNGQEQRYMRRSSSTLGEMLAISDMRKGHIRNNEEESRGSTSGLISESNMNIKDECDDIFPRNLLRSKSLPVSSTIDDSKDFITTKRAKSSFKGKVSSLFSSKNRKPSKEKSSQSNNEDHVSLTGCVEGLSANLLGLGKSFSPEPEENIAGNSIATSVVNSSENQDQPSPISVLDPPFEIPLSSNLSTHRQVQSNLIDKSPLIGSISRTLSWDNNNINNSCAETTTSDPLKSSILVKDYEQECFFFVQTLLSESGLDNDTAPSSSPGSFLARWHSPESPLDPSLTEKYAKDSMRSTRKLVFDCVNTALVDLSGYRSGPPVVTVDCVWDRIKNWFVLGCTENNSVIVETMLRDEVAGSGWSDNLRFETDSLEKEIEIGLIDELLQEAVIEFRGNNLMRLFT